MERRNFQCLELGMAGKLDPCPRRLLNKIFLAEMDSDC